MTRFASYLSISAAMGLLAIVACDGNNSNKPQAKPPGRFVAVQAAPEAAPLAWCDKSFEGDSAPFFEFPEVEADQEAAPSQLEAGHWTWVNLWATWCKPCREEMPMLTKWEKSLDKDGLQLDLHFLSVDEDTDALKRFWEKSPELAIGQGTSRLITLATMPAWLAKYQLSDTTPIPVQFLITPDKRVRCIREGSVQEDDLAKVERIMKAG